jgi:hypothetical protein
LRASASCSSLAFDHRLGLPAEAVELVLAAALGADLALEGLDLLVDPGELGVDRL